MAFAPYLSALLLTAFSYLLLTALRTRTRLSAFKGPFLASFSESWLFWQTIRSRVAESNEDQLRKHGDYARIGPNLLVTNSPDLLRHMSAPRSTWTRSFWYNPFKFDSQTENVFSTRDEKQHTFLRSKVGPAYSGRAVDNLESSVEDQVRNLIRYVRSYADAGKTMDVVHMSHYFTLDVLSQIAFGAAFGYLEADRDLYDYNKSSQAFMPILELVVNHAWFQKIFLHPRIAALLAPKETDEIGQGRIIRIAREAVAKRYAEKSQHRNDMLGHMIAQGLPAEQAMSEVGIQILAGTDSTSGLIRMTLLKIVTSPRVYAALRHEIDYFVSTTDSPSTSIIRDTDARRLPYLQAVIWEGVRLCPPLFGLQTKVAPPEGDTVGGVHFPGGVHVGCCHSSMTRRKDIFGADNEIFRPERWIEADETTYAKYMGTVELVFGSGRFGCLGKNIGVLELNKVFFELLRHFDFNIVNPIKPVKVHYGHGIWIQEGMDMTVTNRPR